MVFLINKDYYRIYEYFGNPEERMIEVFDALRNGLLSMPDKSELYSMPQTQVKRVNLNCDELRNDFPPKVMRNLLHWFIDVEGYSQLGWIPVEKKINYQSLIDKLEKIRKSISTFPDIDSVISELDKIIGDYNEKIKPDCDHADNLDKE